MTTGRTLYPDRPTDPKGTVYLIHLDRPLAGSTAQHYIGWSQKVDEREIRHEAGRGAAFLREANRQGIEWRIVRTWEDVTRRKEYQLKNWGKAWQLCPCCRERTGYGHRGKHSHRGIGGRFARKEA